MSELNERSVPRVDLSPNTFDGFVADCDVAVVEFWTSWSASCRQMALVVDRVMLAHPRARTGRVDCTSQPGLTNRFRAGASPLILLFRRGSLAERIEGSITVGDLSSRIARLLDGQAVTG